MAGWQNGRKRDEKNLHIIPVRKKVCRICGQTITYGSMCDSCAAFIRQKRYEERNNKA